MFLKNLYQHAISLSPRPAQYTFTLISFFSGRRLCSPCHRARRPSGHHHLALSGADCRRPSRRLAPRWPRACHHPPYSRPPPAHPMLTCPGFSAARPRGPTSAASTFADCGRRHPAWKVCEVSIVFY
jgi:hypothetical protein